MAVTPQILKQPEPKRDRYGRPTLILPGQTKRQALTRVTTLASTMSDKYGLEQWACRMTAIGIAQREDLLKAVAATPADDSKTLNQLVSQAKEAAGSSVGATTGTALHQITEQIDTGRLAEPPEMFVDHVNLYKTTLANHNIEIIPSQVERFVVNTHLQVAGTADRIVAHQNKYRIADLKTGKWLDWGEIAIQLACYANADMWYDTANDQAYPPTVEIDRKIGIVIHLPSTKQECTIYYVDLEQGWESAQLAAQVRGWRNKTKPVELELSTQQTVEQNPADIPDPTGPLKMWITQRLTWLKTHHPNVLKRLGRVWPKDLPTFKQTDQHTIAQLETIHDLLVTVERAERIPFSETPAPTRVNIALQHAVDQDFTMTTAIVLAATEQRTSNVNDLTETEITVLQQLCQQIHDGTLHMVASTTAPGGWRIQTPVKQTQDQLSFS